MREGVAAALESQRDIVLVAEASNGREAVDCFFTHPSRHHADGSTDARDGRYRGGERNSRQVSRCQNPYADDIQGRCASAAGAAGLERQDIY